MGKEKQNLSNEEILEKVKERRNKRARRVARSRWLKNLIWWLFGVFSSFFILFGVVAVFVCAIPVNTIVEMTTGKEDNSDIFSERVLEDSVLSLGMNVADYNVGDLPVLKNAIIAIFPEYTEYKKPSEFNPKADGVDVSNLYVKLGDQYIVAFTETGEYQAYANAESALYKRNTQNLDKLLFEYLAIEGTPDRTDSEFNARIYYYKTADGKYKRAFKDNNAFETGVDENTQLYLIDLDDVPFADFTDIGLDRIKNIELVSLFKALNLSSFVEEEDDEGRVTPTLVSEFLGNMTIGGVQDMSFGDRLNSISLSSVFSISGNEDLYNIIVDVSNHEKEESEWITAEEVTVGTLTNDFNVGAIKLSTVLIPEDNQKLYDILVPAVQSKEGYVGTATAENIVIDDLKGLNIDGIELVSVLPYSNDNAKLYDILLDVTGVETVEELTVEDMTTFNTDNIHLTSVISDTPENATLYNILCDATGKSKADIIINDLSGFSTDNVKLTTVLAENSGNAKLFDVLRDVTGATSNDQIVVGDLETFDTEKIRLSTVFDHSNHNAIIAELLAQEDPEDPATYVTVGNIDDKIDNLDFGTIYGVECFVEYNGEDKARYTLDGEDYVLDPNGEYVISQEAGIWLFLMYEMEDGDGNGTGDIDENGDALRFNKTHLAVRDMSSNIMNLSDYVLHATVKQFVECGMLTGPYHDDLMKMRIDTVITTLNDTFVTP